MCGVNELAGKISGVGCFESRIGETFAGAVCGNEILENGQTLAEVCGDRLLDDFAGRLGHLTAHTCELFDLGAVTTGTGIDHHEHWVHVAAVVIVFQRAEKGVGDLFTSVSPDILHLVFALAIRDDASAVLLLHLGDFAVGLFEKLHFFLRNHHVIDTNRDTSASGLAETEFLQAIQSLNGCLLAARPVATPNDVGELLLTADLVVETERLWPDLVEGDTTSCGFDD